MTWLALSVAVFVTDDAEALAMRAACRDWRVALDAARLSHPGAPSASCRADPSRCSSCARRGVVTRHVRYAFDPPPGRAVAICSAWRCGGAALRSFLRDSLAACSLPGVRASAPARPVLRLSGGYARCELVRSAVRWTTSEGRCTL